MRGQFVPEWNKSTLLKIVYPSIRQVRGATPPNPRGTMPVMGFVRSSRASRPPSPSSCYMMLQWLDPAPGKTDKIKILTDEMRKSATFQRSRAGSSRSSSVE